MLETVEIESGARADAAVIWMHGLGADGHDFEPLVPELRLPERLRVRFVFPHAPVRPVTINAGLRMRAWYDIVQLGGGAEDESGIRGSQAEIEALVARERARGVPARRLVLAGFSQGGAMALHTALRHPEPLAGIVALSTWLPLAAKLAAERSPASAGVPVFLAHGTEDPMVPLALARAARDVLETLGHAVEWREYPTGHAVCPEEVADIAAFLVRIL
jgi:phospholipase/carboxylesterase